MKNMLKNNIKYDKPLIKLSGDDALVVEFGDGIDVAVNREVHRLMRRLEDLQADYIVEMVPTYRSLLVQYNPLLISFREISEIIAEKAEERNAEKSSKKQDSKKESRMKNAWFIPRSGAEAYEEKYGSSNRQPHGEVHSALHNDLYGERRVEMREIPAGEYGDYVRLIEIPTLYGGEHGQDLDHVAETNGLSPLDVVRIHSGRDYLVYMLGFMPGFPYLGGLDERIHTPRLANPRTKISAGSVGIAGSQTGIYPSDSPGGWQLIGRTPLCLYHPDEEESVSVSSGDYIRYIPIGLSEYIRLEKKKGLRPRTRLIHRSELRDRAEVEISQNQLGDFAEGYQAGDSFSGILQCLDDGHVVPNDRAEICVRVRVLSPGALTTVQDLGRTGYQKFGIPVAGAMDQFSCRLANILVGNREDEAVLEATYMGPELLFENRAAIAVTGGRLQPKINGVEIPMNRRIFVNKGDVLSLGSALSGIRAYIAIAGSLSVPLVNGSKSTYLKSAIGGHKGRKLQREDVLEFICPDNHVSVQLCSGSECCTEAPLYTEAPLCTDSAVHNHDGCVSGGIMSDISFRGYGAETSQEYPGGTAEDSADGIAEIRVVPGPQEDYFTEKGIQTFFSEAGYEITQESDRMGMKLSGPAVELAEGADIVSDATVLGAVQIPASGVPIILLADRQTTGGYAKIGVVVKEDVYRLAQMPPGTRVRFKAVGIEEAQELYLSLYRRLDSVRMAVRRGGAENGGNMRIPEK